MKLLRKSNVIGRVYGQKARIQFVAPFLLFLFFSISLFAQTSNPNGFEAGNITGWAFGGGTADADSYVQLGSGAGNVRTGSYSILVFENSTSTRYGENTSYTVSTTVSFTYCHAIAWAKATTTGSFTANPGLARSGSSSNGTLQSVNNSSWTRVTHSWNASPFDIYPRLRKSAVAGGVYFDDVILYTGSSATTDILSPNQPTGVSGSFNGTNALLTWSSGGDNAATGTTGVQATLVLKYTGNGTPTAPALNNQAAYAVNDIPATDWIVVKNDGGSSGSSVDVGAISVTTTYAVYHRDLAYNWSSGATTTVSAGFSNPTSLSFTTPASTQTDRLTLTWSAPSGYTAVSNTILGFIKSGSVVTVGTPTSSLATYTASTDFGSPGTAYQNDASAFCFYKGDGTNGDGSSNSGGGGITITGLSPNTTYHILLFGVDDATPTYSSGATTNATTLKAEPTNQPTSFVKGTVTTANIPLNWTAAVAGAQAPDGYLIKLNTGTVTDPVDGTDPANATAISSGAANVKTTGTSYSSFTGAVAGTMYNYKMYSYTNTGTSINFNTTSPLTFNVATLPDAVTGFSFAGVDASSATISWSQPGTYSSGNHTTLVFVKANSAVTQGTPTNDPATYTASNDFSSPGTAYQGDGAAYCVYKGDGTSVTVSNLSAGVTYHVLVLTVVDAANSDATNSYSAATTGSGSTLKAEPTNQPTSFATGSVTTSNIPLTWVAAVAGAQAPDAYLIKLSTSSVTDPSDGVDPADATAISGGNANVKTAGTSYSSFTGFSSGTMYNFKIYSYTNAGSSIDFNLNSPPSLNMATLPNAVTAPSFSITGGSTGTLSWTAASGYNSGNHTTLVFIKAGSAVTTGTPTNTPATYTASADVSSPGTAYQNDGSAFCIYKGDATSVALTGLSGSTTYHVLILTVVDATNYDGGCSYSAATTANATTYASYTWSGGANASFATAGNWTPSRSVTASTDILTFNTGGSITATGVTTQTIGQLIVNSNTSVTLQAATAQTLSVGTSLTIASGSTLIQSTNLGITISASATATVNGTLEIAAGTYTTTASGAVTSIDGASAIMRNSGGTITGSGTGLLFKNNATYHHAVNANSIPTANWTSNGGSTVNVTGITSTSPGATLNQAFNNVTWNCTSQSVNVVFGTTGLSISGTLNVISTGSSNSIQLTSGSGVTALTVGAYTQSGGDVFIFATSGRSLTVNGDFNLSSGTFHITKTGQGTATSGVSLNVRGAFVQSGGTLANTVTNSTAPLQLNGTGASQNLTLGTTSGTFHLTLNNSSGAALQANATIGGTLTLTSGTLTTGSYTLTMGGSVSVTSGNINASSGTVVFNGSSAQNIPAATFTGNIANATINNSAGVTFNANQTITSTLTLTSGTLTFSASTLTMGNGGVINRTSGTLAASPVFTTSVDVVYPDGAAVNSGNEIPSNTSILNNLTINNTSGVTFTTNVTVNGTFTVSNGAVFNAGTATVHTLKGNWNNNGTFNCGTSKFILQGSVLQTMSGSTFYDLEIDNISGVQMLTNETVTNTLTLTTGAFDVNNNVLTVNSISKTSGTITAGGTSSVVITGTSGNIPDETFASNSVANLTINASGGTVTSEDDFSVATTLTLTAGTFDNNGASNNKVLTLSNGSTIIRSGGSLSAAPVFGSTGTDRVNVTISGTCSSGEELNGTTGGVGTLTVSSGTYTMSAAATVDNLTVTSLLDGADKVITPRASGSVTINGTFRTAVLDGFSGSATTAISNTNTPTITLGASSTIEYNATSGTQTVQGRTDYVNLTLSGNASKTISSGIEISGNFSVSGGTATPPATMTFDGSSTQSISGLAWTNLAFSGASTKQFTSGGSITGTLSVSGNNVTIDADGPSNNIVFTLQSSASATARIADLTNGNTNTGNSITGNITAERYIGNGVTPKRAWRLLSAPVTGVNIFNAWQDGGSNASGYGTQITGSGGGFDAGNASIKTWNGTAWVTNQLTATNSGDVTDYQGYMVFVRGDRTTTTGVNVTPVDTRLRPRGTVRQGTFNSYVTVPNTAGYTLLGNPYASAIDFEAINADYSDLTKFYAWDPQQSGSYGVGAYNMVERTGAATYDVTPQGGSAASNNTARYIPQGVAVLVHNPTGAGSPVTVDMKESYKTSSSSTLNYYRTSSSNMNMAVNLTTAAAQVIDGIRVRYDASYSNNITAEDAQKLYNNNENIAISSQGQFFIVEKRNSISQSDTVQLRLTGMKQQQYQLVFYPADFSGVSQAYVEDSYLNSVTAISLVNTTTLGFTVDANAASTGNRFRIVFRTSAPLPVTFNNIRAYQRGSGVMVEWNVSAENNIRHYEVERSSDGRSFSKLGTVNAKGNNNSSAEYNYTDASPLTTNYYRIKSVGVNGEEKYSAIVRVNLGKGAEVFTVYPNPVKGDQLSVQLSSLEKGRYMVRMINAGGQVMMQQQLVHGGGSATEQVTIPPGVSRGIYRIELRGANIQVTKTIVLQ